MSRDPFDDLRMTAEPATPGADFVARLRRGLVAALAGGDLPTIELPDPSRAGRAALERSIPMSTTTTEASSPATTTSLIPYLCVAGAPSAIEWYATVFGATVAVRYDGDDGRVGHAELVVGGAHLFLADEYPEIGVVGPQSLGGTAVSLHLTVADVDRVYATAVGAGAESQREPADEAYGARSATIVDPFGHRWMIQTTIAAPTVAELNETMDGYTVTAPAAAGAPPVELGYFTVSAPDTQRAARFYGALFGWTTEVGHLGGEYAHVNNTVLPLGVVPGPADAPAVLYYRVDELAPYVAKVRELGGQVLSESAYDSGHGAECVDDQGRPFQLWQPAPGY